MDEIKHSLYRELNPSIRATWHRVAVSGKWFIPGEIEEMKNWCNIHCSSRWTYGKGQQFSFWFRSPLEQTAFALRWSLADFDAA